jgi:hypothetical protein
LHAVHLRILIERKTRSDRETLSPEKVAETAVAALLDGTAGRILGFNVEGYRWMEKGRSAPTVALSSLVQGWDRDLEGAVRRILASLCLELDQEAIAVAISPAESFVVTRDGHTDPLP